MAATLFADADMVGLLLKHGADPNGVGPAGTTALMWAAPNLPVAKVLVSYGANVNAKSALERTPLLVAANYPGTIDLLRLLLEQGADLRAQDRTGVPARAAIRLHASRSPDDRLLDVEGGEPGTGGLHCGRNLGAARAP
jgi:ankyrin repeat protein